jgi:glycosyltransferase involved in cell wall biosynthesis
MLKFLEKSVPITSQQWSEDTVPLVSISCITYNHENFIRDAIEGFLMQKTNFPVEILIHDDASTDKTASIVREYEEKYPHLIKPIYQTENQYSKRDGTIGRIQRGRARGKYIAICEGDDYWTDPLKLQKQVDFLEKNIEYSGCAHQSIVVKNDLEYSLFNINVPKEVGIKDLIGGRLFHTASILFIRDVLTLFNDAPPVFSGDRFLFIFISLRGKIRFFDETMGIYRKHDKGASSIATIQQMKLDLKSIPYLTKICPTFPKYRYKSYVLATIGLTKNGSFLTKLHYLSLSFLYSFSYFPENIFTVLKFLKKRIK